MTRIAPINPIPVEIEPRRHMTDAEKLARWEALGRCCTVCHHPCEPLGPTVIWDHRVQLSIGGTNDLSNMEPHHAAPKPCAAIKTAQDAKDRAKAKRLAFKHSNRREDWPATQKIAGRQFKSRWGS